MDLTLVSKVWCSETALVCVSVNTKEKEGCLMTWATPVDGITRGKWYKPILQHWGLIAPRVEEGRVSLFPYFEKDRTLNFVKKSTGGAVQAALNRLEKN